MAAHLVLLHTRPADVEIYEPIGAALAPRAQIDHVVRRNWRLHGLRKGFGWALRQDVAAFVEAAGAPVACTCPVLGEVAEFAGATRIERPALRGVARHGGPLLLVTVDNAATDPLRAALEAAMAAEGRRFPVISLALAQFEPLFRAGDLAGFHAAVAAGVIEALSARPDLGAVLLAESRLQPVAHLLTGAGPALFTIPEPGLRQALGVHARMSLGEPITT